MAAATMALSSSFAAAAAGGAPWRGVVGAGRAAEETTTSSTPTPTPSPAAAVPKAKSAASTGLWDVLAFSGPAPEPINGRLAMVGFVSALAVEASRGGELLEEASSGGGLAWFAATAAVCPSRPSRRRLRVPRRRCLCPTDSAPRGRLLVVAAAAASLNAHSFKDERVAQQQPGQQLLRQLVAVVAHQVNRRHATSEALDRREHGLVLGGEQIVAVALTALLVHSGSFGTGTRNSVRHSNFGVCSRILLTALAAPSLGRHPVRSSRVSPANVRDEVKCLLSMDAPMRADSTWRCVVPANRSRNLPSLPISSAERFLLQSWTVQDEILCTPPWRDRSDSGGTAPLYARVVSSVESMATLLTFWQHRRAKLRRRLSRMQSVLRLGAPSIFRSVRRG
uniref:Uncharacterized protein n=1 Tax=Oryza nivara TaxID=4536 RepID=A0A0E0GY94_ORYNI